MSRQKNDSERLLDEFSRWIVTIPSAETVDSHTVSIFITNTIQGGRNIRKFGLIQIRCF